MPELARFQDAFSAALRGQGDLSPWGAPDALAPGLTVYRNTSAKGCLDALRGNFPTVERLVGEAWFAGCAREHIAETTPDQPALLAYGADFPDFLAAFPPAADIAYLPDVARLDWLWLEAHTAADSAPLAAQDVAALAPEDLIALKLRFHPATRLCWCDSPAPTIWRLTRPPAEPAPIEIDWRGEGIVLARPDGAVESLILDAPGHAFLAACEAGAKLGEAAGAALALDPDFDLAAAFGAALSLGVFAAETT